MMKAAFKALIIFVVIAAASVLVLAACSSDGGNETEPVSTEQIPYEDVSLNVYFFNAGKADAMLITTGGGAVIVDAGEKGFGKTVVSFLEEKGIDGIDYFVITHFDKDHVGGAAKIIKSVPVSNVLQSNYPKSSTEYENYTEALGEAGLTPHTVSETYEFELDGVSFSIDPPAKKYTDDPSNNSSLIMTVKCGERTLLFTGDAESDRLEEFIGKGLASKCDFIKMPHHGRWDDELKDLVSLTRPAYAVITSSDDEPEDEKTVTLLDSFGVKTFYTRTAPVTLTCDGRTVGVGYDGITK